MALAEATRWMGGGAAPRTLTRRWQAPRPTCASSALLPAASTSPRVRSPRLVTARPTVNRKQIAVARFFAENLATAAPGLKETVIAGADSALTLPDAMTA